MADEHKIFEALFCVGFNRIDFLIAVSAVKTPSEQCDIL